MEKSNNQKKKIRIRYHFLERRDLGRRLLSFLLDLAVVLSPMAIWNIMILGVLGSLVSVSGMNIVSMITVVILFVSILLLNPYILSVTKGQTVGMYFYDFRLIHVSGKRANIRQIQAREFLGFGLPFALLLYFTNFIGVVIYWLINATVVFIDRKHRSIIDIILQTCVVTIEETSDLVEKAPIKHTVEKKVVVTKKEFNPIDLQIHSTFSLNGEYSIEEIFNYAKNHKMHTISITDINTAKGNMIAKRLSELYKINYVTGIEICATLHNQTLHVLGYFIDPNFELYTNLENESLLAERKASLKRIRLFEECLGKQIYVDDLLDNNKFQIISGEMIAKYVLNDSRYDDCVMLDPYREQGDNAYKAIALDYFYPNKPCFVQCVHPSLEDVLDIIHLSGGISVLSDPNALYENHPFLLEDAISKGVDGLQVFRPDYTRREMAKVLKIAKDNHLYVTCGSDFYCDGKGRAIGDCGCPKEAITLVEILLNKKHHKE